MSHLNRDGVIVSMNASVVIINQQVEDAEKEKDFWRCSAHCAMAVIGTTALLDSIAFADTWLSLSVRDTYENVDEKNINKIYYKDHKFYDPASKEVQQLIKASRIPDTNEPFIDFVNTAKHASMFCATSFQDAPLRPKALPMMKQIIPLLKRAINAFTHNRQLGTSVSDWLKTVQ